MPNGITPNPWKHLSPEESARRLRVLEVLKTLEEIDASTLTLLSAEEIFELGKTIALIGHEFFSQEFIDLQERNPEVISGETVTDGVSRSKRERLLLNSGQDSLVGIDHPNPLLGTVESRKRNEKRSRMRNSPQSKSFFQSLFGTFKHFKELLERYDRSSFEDTVNRSAVLLEAARSNSLDLSLVPTLRVVNKQDSVEQASSLNDIRSMNRRIANLGYIVRKRSEAKKAKNKSNRRRQKRSSR